VTDGSYPVQPVLSSSPYRVILTGGPGGGKTTAADLFEREIGDRVTLIPHTTSFFKKMTIGLGILENFVAQLPEPTR